jgi:hypothetical protein
VVRRGPAVGQTGTLGILISTWSATGQASGGWAISCSARPRARRRAREQWSGEAADRSHSGGC